MLGWLWKLFGYRPRDERQLFRYFDGQRVRWCDPVAAWSHIEAVAGEDWVDLLRMVAKPVPPGAVGQTLVAFRVAQKEAAQKVADAACVAFGVEVLTDAEGAPVGLTAGERIALVAAYLDFMGGLALAARPLAKSPPPTAASPAA